MNHEGGAQTTPTKRAATSAQELPEISDTEKLLFQYLGYRSPVIPLGLCARSHHSMLRLWLCLRCLCSGNALQLPDR